MRYVNIDMTSLKAACVKQWEARITMFLGCDVGKFSDGDGWFMDLDLLDLEVGFETSLLRGGEEKKADRLRSGESNMTHAMALTGVRVEDWGSVRRRAQDIWGETRGQKGWFVMGHAWLDEFTYQAVIHPRIVDSKFKDVSDMELGLLPLWDPMGSLACVITQPYR